MSVVENFKNKMKEQNITMNDLVRATGIKKSTLYYLLESDKHLSKTKTDNYLAIADYILNKKCDMVIGCNIPHPNYKRASIATNKFLEEYGEMIQKLSKQDLDILALIIKSMASKNPNTAKEN